MNKLTSTVDIDAYITKQVQAYASRHRIDKTEGLSEGWLAYMEAAETYYQVEGCCNFSTYVTFCIQDRLDSMRQRRNERILLESNFSLDIRFGDSNESASQRIFQGQGDFTNTVALWDFIQSMGKLKYRILVLMNYLFSDWEIMQIMQISPEEYNRLLAEIRQSFQEWLLL